MVKRITGALVKPIDQGAWKDLADLADVDLTSEDPDSPVEHVFAHTVTTGWRAAGPGIQTIRLRFRRPVQLTRILVLFEEMARPRTQEFVLAWRAAGEMMDVEILRQQFTFAPPDTIIEREDYRVHLIDVSELALSITPDISGGQAIATLQEFCVA